MTDSNGLITPLENVPDETTFLFTVRATAGDEEREAILVRAGEGVEGWLNYCRHWLDVRLDKGSGAPMRDGEIVCAKHGAMFDAGDGACTFGPCAGARLEPIAVAVEEGAVYLADPEYEFVGAGPSGVPGGSDRRGLDF